MKALAITLLLLANETAGEWLERGLRSYAVGRYDEAIDAFQRGYEIEPRPDFLYALGQAQRMRGDCKAAAASYRAYLRTSPAERAAAPARQNLERCERELAHAPPAAAPSSPASPPTVAAPPSPATAAPLPTTTPTTTPTIRKARRARDDTAAGILCGVGAAALVAGGALWGVGENGARNLADARRYDQFAARAGEADAYERERLAGIIVVAAGGALVVGAAARWIWVARRR